MAEKVRKDGAHQCERCRTLGRTAETPVRKAETLGQWLCAWCWVRSTNPEGRTKRP